MDREWVEHTLETVADGVEMADMPTAVWAAEARVVALAATQARVERVVVGSTARTCRHGSPEEEALARAAQRAAATLARTQASTLAAVEVVEVSD
jgi:hypothetical protein